LRYISLLREYRPDGVNGRRRSGTLAIELRRSRVLADAARPVVITTREACREQFRRTLGLPEPAVQALRALRESQAGERLAAGEGWQDTALVFTTHLGIALDAGNVRKMFKRVCEAAGAGMVLPGRLRPLAALTICR
jgi:hypothetical protein